MIRNGTVDIFNIKRNHFSTRSGINLVSISFIFSYIIHLIFSTYIQYLIILYNYYHIDLLLFYD